MIITQTPFRMSFFGGGTDMESFFRENGGSVLSTTFDKYCYVNVRHLPRFFDYSTELSYSKTERVTNIDVYLRVLAFKERIFILCAVTFPNKLFICPDIT